MSFDPSLPFTREQARAMQITDRQLKGPSYRQLLHGVYVDARVKDTPLIRARAALLVHPPAAVATHHSSARIIGAPVPPHPLEHVSVPRSEDRRQRHGLRCHVAALKAGEIRTVSGVRISGPQRLFLELASCLNLVELVIVGDWLVRQRLVTCDSLVQYCSTTHARYATRARRAASYVRDRVDSPMETRLRMLLVLAGLPEPEVNLEIRDDNGVVVLRFDLSYPSVRLAVEYDGRQHLQDVGQWERDVERRDQVDSTGWRLLTVTSRGLFRDPEDTVTRVREALAARGWRPLPATSDAWRPHFRAVA